MRVDVQRAFATYAVRRPTAVARIPIEFAFQAAENIENSFGAVDTGSARIHADTVNHVIPHCGGVRENLPIFVADHIYQSVVLRIVQMPLVLDSSESVHSAEDLIRVTRQKYGGNDQMAKGAPQGLFSGEHGCNQRFAVVALLQQALDAIHSCIKAHCHGIHGKHLTIIRRHFAIYFLICAGDSALAASGPGGRARYCSWQFSMAEVFGTLIKTSRCQKRYRNPASVKKKLSSAIAFR